MPATDAELSLEISHSQLVKSVKRGCVRADVDRTTKTEQHTASPGGHCMFWPEWLQIAEVRSQKSAGTPWAYEQVPFAIGAYRGGWQPFQHSADRIVAH